MDRREMAHGRPWENFNARMMTAEFIVEDDGGEEPHVYTLNMRFVVCETCEGRGSHVNPSIDSQGLSREDFDDLDFAEEYWGGLYDIRCAECRGDRVVPEPHPETNGAEVLGLIQAWYQDEAAYWALVEGERRAGA